MTTVARTIGPLRGGLADLAAVWLAAACLAASAVAAPGGESGPRAAAITPKPTAPIAISHRGGDEPRIGQPLELVLVVTAKADLKNGIAHLSADEGLYLISPAAEVWLPNLTVEATHEIPVTVLPLVDRRLYLNVAVSGQVAGRLQGRAVGIPIRAGASEAAQAELKTDEDGQRLRALPAEESVR
jgi:hypothetical protein